MPADTDTLAAAHAAVWASGDYALMAEEVMAPLGAVLVGATGITVGTRVLDVAAGSGNISLPAAAMGAYVTSTDLTPKLLERSKRRAFEQGLALDYREANAEKLPFADDEFDVVMSAIGVMFAPHHLLSSAELVRTCRPGGTIGVISWTPDGYFGRMLDILAPYRPSLWSPGVLPTTLWGKRGYLRELFGDRVHNVTEKPGLLPVTRFATGEEVHAYFKEFYGPTIEAYANIGDNIAAAKALDDQLTALAHQYILDGVMHWGYLTVTATKL